MTKCSELVGGFVNSMGILVCVTSFVSLLYLSRERLDHIGCYIELTGFLMVFRVRCMLNGYTLETSGMYFSSNATFRFCQLLIDVSTYSHLVRVQCLTS